MSCTLIIEQKYRGLLATVININNEPLTESTLQSKSKEETNVTTIQVHGLFRTHGNGNFAVYVISNGNGLTIKTNSQLTVTLISKDLLSQAFSLRFKNNVFVSDSMRLSWTSTGTVGSFITTNLFTLSDGYFVCELDGSYFISGNFIIQNGYNRDCDYEVIVYTDNKNVLMRTSKLITNKQTISTINFSGIFSLEKGNKIWLELKTSCIHSRLLKLTTYSLTFLPSTTGFSLTSEKLFSYIDERGWFQINFSPFTNDFKGGFLNPSSAKGTDSIYFHQSGLFIISANILITTPVNVTGLKMAVTRFGRSIATPMREGDLQFLSILPSVTVSQTIISLSFLIELWDNEYLSLSFYFPEYKKWIVLKDSTVSGVLVKSYVNQRVIPQKKMETDAGKWKHVSLCYSDSNANTVDIDKGVLKVLRSGIFYFTTHLTVYNYKHSEMSVAFIYNNEDEFRRKVALYAKETSIDRNFTFKLASTLRINVKHSLGMYVYLPKISTFNIMCHVSLVFIGYISSIIGFQANLKTDLSIKSAVNNSVINYYDSSRNELSKHFYYNTGKKLFSFNDGTFKVPVNGIYLMSVNIIIKDVSMMAANSLVTVMVVYVDSKKNQGAPWKNTALFSKRLRKLKPTDKLSTISFSLTAPIQLIKNKYVVLKVRSDHKCIIDKRTSFSVVLLSELLLARGFLGYRSHNELTESRQWWTLIGWFTKNPSKLKGRFDSTLKSDPKIVDNRKIVIYKSGVYIISFHIHLKQQKQSKSFSIGLFKNSDSLNVNTHVCDELRNPFEVISIGCSIVMYCEQGSEYYVKISSSDGIKMEDFVDEEDKDSFISAIMISNQPSYQASVLKLNVSYLLIKNVIQQTM